MNRPRILGICADDFGLSEGVSKGIIQLVREQRLTAVSVLSGGQSWGHHAQILASEAAVRSRFVEVGLHFNLTEGRPLSAELARHWPTMPALTRLISSAHLRALPVEALRAEWLAQWRAFCDAFGRVPDFIDGHQHVHHLPQVRQMILHALGSMQSAPAVRSTGRLPGSGYGFKRIMIAATGGRALARRLDAMHLRHNLSLWGCYDFRFENYRLLMQQWLKALPSSGALLFCHPGRAGAGAHDPIQAARVRELAYLESPAFQEDLDQNKVRLGHAWCRHD
jgi:predicted glycoside hydrolase/deacetylase ChbG (UPF0249 family)